MRVPVVLCFDRRILLGAGVTILSLLDTAAATTCYEIHVLHPGLPQRAMEAFRRLVAGTRHSLSFRHLPPAALGKVPTRGGSRTAVVYYRLLIPQLYTQYDKVIYSDVDVCVRRDLAEVYAEDLGDYQWAGVAAEANTPQAVCHRHFPENANERIYMSGFMVMNLARMRAEELVDEFLETIEEFGERLRFYDLDVLNLACTAIKPLPFEYVTLEDVYESEDVTQSGDYCFLKSVYTPAELHRARSAPAIIHYAGRRGKPWQRRRAPGSFQAYVDRLPVALRVTTFRDFRKRLLARD